MALIQWNSELGVDVEEFDNHHKKLVALINDLHDAMLGGVAKEVIGTTLDELIDYTRYHFGEEERVMLSHKYPGYAKQKAEHQAFVDKLNGFSRKFASGESILSIEVMGFLRDWLKSHIMKTDRQYTAFFKEKKVA